MKIILNTDGGEYGESTFAVLDLDVDTARYYLSLREKTKPLFTEPQFYAATFFNYQVSVYSQLKPDGLENNEWMEQGSFQIHESHRLHTNYCEINIKPTGVLWGGMVKHSDEEFETVEIPWSVIEEAAEIADSLNKE